MRTESSVPIPTPNAAPLVLLQKYPKHPQLIQNATGALTKYLIVVSLS